jgi:hypothetical protein
VQNCHIEEQRWGSQNKSGRRKGPGVKSNRRDDTRQAGM